MTLPVVCVGTTTGGPGESIILDIATVPEPASLALGIGLPPAGVASSQDRLSDHAVARTVPFVQTARVVASRRKPPANDGILIGGQSS